MEGIEVKPARAAPSKPAPFIPHRPAPAEVRTSPPPARPTQSNGVTPPISRRKARPSGPPPPPRVDLGEAAEDVVSNGLKNEESPKLRPKGRHEITIISARPMGPSGVIPSPTVSSQEAPAHEEPKVPCTQGRKSKGREPPPRPKSRPVSELTLEAGECDGELMTGGRCGNQDIPGKEEEDRIGNDSGLKKAPAVPQRKDEHHKIDSSLGEKSELSRTVENCTVQEKIIAKVPSGRSGVLAGSKPVAEVDGERKTALRQPKVTKDVAITGQKSKPTILMPNRSNKSEELPQKADDKFKSEVDKDKKHIPATVLQGKPPPPAKKPKPALKPKPTSSIDTPSETDKTKPDVAAAAAAPKPKSRPTVILPTKPFPSETQIAKPSDSNAETVNTTDVQVKRSKPNVILPATRNNTEVPKISESTKDTEERSGQAKSSKPTIILPNKPKNTQVPSATEKNEQPGQANPSRTTVILAGKPPTTETAESSNSSKGEAEQVSVIVPAKDMQGEGTGQEKMVAKPRRIPTIIRAARPEGQEAGEGRIAPKRPQRGPSVRKAAPSRPVGAPGEENNERDKGISLSLEELKAEESTASTERKQEKKPKPPRPVCVPGTKQRENVPEAPRSDNTESPVENEKSLERTASSKKIRPSRPPTAESVRGGVEATFELNDRTEDKNEKPKGQKRPPRPPSKALDSQSSKDIHEQSENSSTLAEAASVVTKADAGSKENEIESDTVGARSVDGQAKGTSETSVYGAREIERNPSRKGSRKRPPPPRIQKGDAGSKSETEAQRVRESSADDHMKGTSQSRDSGPHEKAASKAKSKPPRPVSTSVSSKDKPHRPSEPTTKPKEKVKEKAASTQVSSVRETYIVPSAIALYDYEPTALDDLGFSAGDEIVLVKRVDNDWYIGRLGEQEGMFPVKFVEIIEDLPDEVVQEEPPTAAFSHSPFDVVALYDFQGNKHDGELVFTSGETIHVTEKINDDWLRGETCGQTGVFPCNFVDISTDIINQLPVTVAKAAAAENDESAATDSERILYCKGMFDYNSDVPSDLSFNTGDVIKVHKKVGDEWIEGELNGRVGMFPAAYVEMMEDTLGESTTASRAVEYGTAKYDFTGSGSDELSFAKGDKIEVTEVISDDWLRGKLGGHEGMFPRTFVELSQELGTECQSEEKDDEPAPKAKALFDFDGEFEDELSFKVDDIIVLLERVNEEWLRGEMNGKVGRFPATFVDILTPLL
ncbi:SH3 domain-containing protein 19-like [Montipora foliosa]|uniref:SH3 domain-containing protein 19-like n=1 Tax=Montipora foliosa TaxID=591990 RepID=UPI0035F135CD